MDRLREWHYRLVDSLDVLEHPFKVLWWLAIGVTLIVTVLYLFP